MTQQEIAFQLGVNQGRVNEVLKRGKWLQDDPNSEEARARDRAKARIGTPKGEGRPTSRRRIATASDNAPRHPKAKPQKSAQLSIEDFIGSAPEEKTTP